MTSLTNRLIDLTHVIIPGEGARPISIERVPAPQAVSPDLWYIMHRVEMPLNHVGTHIEAPYHVDPEGMDVSEVPLDRLCGSAVILNLTSVAPGETVTEEDLERAAAPAGGIGTDDIVFMRFDYDGNPANNRHFTAEAIAYLVERKIKLLGTDLLGIELPDDDPRLAEQYNHHQLMTAGICLIEQLAHLDLLTQSRVDVYALPVPIRGLDSFPLRVIAIQ
jgi:arylformamidase